MKAGYYVWVDWGNRKVRVSEKYEMVEEFDTRYEMKPYPHKWNVELFEFQSRDEALSFRERLAAHMAGDPKVYTVARNTSLFKMRGPAVGDF